MRVFIIDIGVSEIEHIKSKGEQLLKSDLTDLAPDYQNFTDSVLLILGLVSAFESLC